MMLRRDPTASSPCLLLDPSDCARQKEGFLVDWLVCNADLLGDIMHDLSIHEYAQYLSFADVPTTPSDPLPAQPDENVPILHNP